jgi:DNA-binding NarL/FixJ family response regulator
MDESNILANSSLTPKNDIKVMIVDDHPLMHDALRVHLEGESDIRIVAEASDGEEAVKLASELIPDVIIMDIEMPKLNGIEATRRIKAQNPKIQVLALTVHNDSEYILKVLEAGAAGYMTKTTLGENLVRAVRSIVDGESVLSADVMDKLLKHSLRYPLERKIPDIENILNVREMQIFKLAAKGLKSKEIAQEVNLNVRTIKGYLSNIYSKLNVSSRTEAVIVGLRNGLLNSDDIN